jgi:ATP-dependent protease ClpP protease subunit
MKHATRITTAPALHTHTKPYTFTARPERSLEWLGGVTYDNLYRTIGDLKSLLIINPDEEIQMTVSSFGGATGIAMSLYDSVRLMKPVLTTVGTGDVDSSGVIVFLCGTRRYITKNTTLLFHLAGRTFSSDRRYTTLEMEAMLKEDNLKDYQYACVVSDSTGGFLTPVKVLDMMKKNTILTAEEAVQMKIAHAVL